MKRKTKQICNPGFNIQIAHRLLTLLLQPNYISCCFKYSVSTLNHKFISDLHLGTTLRLIYFLTIFLLYWSSSTFWLLFCIIIVIIVQSCFALLFILVLSSSYLYQFECSDYFNNLFTNFSWSLQTSCLKLVYRSFVQAVQLTQNLLS